HGLAVVREQLAPDAARVLLLGLRGGLLLLLEDGGVLDPAAQVEADEAHRPRDEERDAPAPLGHGVLAKQQRRREHDRRSEHKTAERAELEEAAVEAALLVGRVLGHERGGTTVLAA